MKALHVLYDARCAFCRRCRAWLGQQPAYVPLVFAPLQSVETARRFPGIETFEPEERMVVIGDDGSVWYGQHAWIMCLWALREYREWSLRLANPALMPFARRVCEFISENRHALSRWIFHNAESQDALIRQLEALPVAADDRESYCKA